MAAVKQSWPRWMYKRGADGAPPEGRVFQRLEDVPAGWVTADEIDGRPAEAEQGDPKHGEKMKALHEQLVAAAGENAALNGLLDEIEQKAPPEFAEQVKTRRAEIAAAPAKAADAKPRTARK